MQKKRGPILSLAFAATALLAQSACTDSAEGCGNELLSEARSPGGGLRAVVFRRDCGATTGFNTQISVLPAGEELPNEGGNTFVADSDHGAAPSGRGGGPLVGARWLNEGELLVEHDGRARVFRAEQSSGGVRIRYERLAP